MLHVSWLMARDSWGMAQDGKLDRAFTRKHVDMFRTLNVSIYLQTFGRQRGRETLKNVHVHVLFRKSWVYKIENSSSRAAALKAYDKEVWRGQK